MFQGIQKKVQSKNSRQLVAILIIGGKLKNQPGHRHTHG